MPAAITARRRRRSRGRSPNARRAQLRGILAGLDVDAQPNPDRKPPKVISPSDPCSAWTAKANKRVQFGYGLNYLIDLENAVIVDVEPTPARTYDEVASTETMLDRTERCFGLKPKRLAADTAYGTGRFLGWLVDQRIVPHIPVRDASERDDGTLSRSDFRWDRRRSIYICPNGKVLHTTGWSTKAPRFDIALLSSTAKSVRSKCSAVPIAQHARFPAMFMNTPAT